MSPRPESTEAVHDDCAPAGIPAADFAAILDSVRDVVIVTAADGSILYSNRSAEELLERKGPLRVVQGRIRGADGAPDQALRRQIEAACTESKAPVPAIVMRHHDQVPLVLVVRCLEGSGRALLLAFDSHPPTDRLAAPLRECIGLTRSEAEVAAAIAQGSSTAQIAARRGVAASTIKSQIRTIAAKLGCTSRSQIAAVVKAVPLAPYRP